MNSFFSRTRSIISEAARKVVGKLNERRHGNDLIGFKKKTLLWNFSCFIIIF